jgi:hypothetical protein
MHTSSLLVATLSVAAFAAPQYPLVNMDAASSEGWVTLSEYFNMLAEKVQNSRRMSTAPVCDLANAQLPTGMSHGSPHGQRAFSLTPLSAAPKPLPPPGAGLILKHVAIGRGTQNYTCDTNNATATPASIGAVATLFNASCVASIYPDLLNLLPDLALQFQLPDGESPQIGPTGLIVSGKHYFTNAVTPFFNLDTPAQSLGEAPCSKNASSTAPVNAPSGLQGEPATSWLKLVTKTGATGNLREVYRVETAGGSAPATCSGMPAAFEVQYAAQ